MGELLELAVDCTIHNQLSDLVQVAIEPVGKLYHEYERIKKKTSHDHHLVESDATDDSKSSIKDVDLEIDMEYLKDLDHRLWKNQDHYQVLGLQKYRYKASDKDIKKAYHHIILLCHPDKKKDEGKEVLTDSSFLQNVKKAFDILGDPIKRKGYDSVDPLFDDDIPSEKAASKSNFYRVYGPVFERNSRFSVKKNVPLLGDAFSSKEYVDHFYEFWYTFESWRDFSYEDEEKPEGADDKEERWYIAKQNKAERMAKLKKENGRIKKLIDNAYYADPRIKKFREEENLKKEALKKAKKQEIYDRKQKEIEELKKIENEAQRKKDEEELEVKAKQQREKKEKEAIKKELKVTKKVWEDIFKEKDYFVHDEGDRVQAMMDVDMLSEGLELLDLKDLIEDVKTQEAKIECRKLIRSKVEDLKSGKIGNNFLAGVSTPMNRVSRPKQVRKKKDAKNAKGGKVDDNNGKNKENSKPVVMVEYQPSPNTKPRKKK